MSLWQNKTEEERTAMLQSVGFDKPLAKEYEKDYKAMTGSFIYDTTPLTFEELEKRIKELEEKFRSGEPHSYPTSTPQVDAIVDAISDKLLSVKEIMELMQLKDRKSFLYGYLYPAIESGFVELLYPENPKHPKQKYRLTDKGKELLKQ